MGLRGSAPNNVMLSKGLALVEKLFHNSVCQEGVHVKVATADKILVVTGQSLYSYWLVPCLAETQFIVTVFLHNEMAWFHGSKLILSETPLANNDFLFLGNCSKGCPCLLYFWTIVNLTLPIPNRKVYQYLGSASFHTQPESLPIFGFYSQKCDLELCIVCLSV